MLVEITPTIIFGGLGTLSALCTGTFALGNLQWYRRSEGAELTKAVVVLVEAVKGLAEVKASLSRVHERLDAVTSEVSRLAGVCSQTRKEY
jgi:hypothetical protein